MSIKSNNIATKPTGCFLFYLYFNEHCKMIAVDLNKKQALDVDLKVIEQISFTANLARAGNAAQYFSLLKREKKAFQIFHQKL